MRHHGCRGFTLLELIIVVAILGILMALLMPGMQNVWALADDHRCTTNLYYLSQAIAMRRGDVSMSSRTELRTLRWPTQLLPYAEQAAALLMCPVPSLVEDPAPVSDTADGSSSSGGWGLGPDGGGSGGSDGFKAYPPLTELAEIKIGSKTALAMDAGPYVLKLSDEQFQPAFSQGWFGIDNSLNDARGHFDCTYHTGANPDLYYLCVEDSLTTAGANQDFNDVVIRVVDKHNGSYELSVTTATAGTHAIISKPDGQTLLQLAPGGYGGRGLVSQQISVGVADETADVTPGERPAVLNMYDGDVALEGAAVLSSNYAMNADNKFLNYRAGAVALMDYYRYIFHYTDDWGTPTLDPNHDGIPNFARHRGRINVLLTDGSVQFMDPADLNPVNLDAYLRYWAP